MSATQPANTASDKIVSSSKIMARKDYTTRTDTVSRHSRPRKAFHSPAQLAKLKTGRKTHLFVGPSGEQYVGVEDAYVKVLAHYSNYAKKKLLDDRASGLVIIDGAKITIKWIYKYMLAGETDPDDQTKFEDLNIAELVIIYSHCVVLEYPGLMDRILLRLREKLFNALPDVSTIKNINTFAPVMNDMVAHAVGRVMVQPLIFAYGPYEKHVAEDQDFATLVGSAVDKILEQRIQAGIRYYNQPQPNRHVDWSNRYYLRKTAQAATETRKHKQQVAGIAKSTTFVSENSLEVGKKLRNGKKKPFCYKCQTRGHWVRDCAQSKAGVTQDLRATGVPVNAPPQAEPSAETRELVRAIKEVTRATRAPIVCYACNDEGHIARNCPTPPAAYTQARTFFKDNKVLGDMTAQDQTRANIAAGRKMNYRRAKSERTSHGTIAIMGNGEGLRTCDREVRQGEFTRTGLQV
ncbi:hypothetical protein K504DRAFT_530099 [Pleomassaria siparia CBS 279.74]|uniref:CCHC-type domain-containing protein n=1 Tax=Pleomassaria siparia CBS 279.74 TaxID=1314801 RepID=A0A6G1KJK7_9PLEO|nr:hypothetical protein K504DRAFT_530099 [Pleomassaria siparia CBS 279.74]